MTRILSTVDKYRPCDRAEQRESVVGGYRQYELRNLNICRSTTRISSVRAESECKPNCWIEPNRATPVCLSWLFGDRTEPNCATPMCISRLFGCQRSDLAVEEDHESEMRRRPEQRQVADVHLWMIASPGQNTTMMSIEIIGSNPMALRPCAYFAAVWSHWSELIKRRNVDRQLRRNRTLTTSWVKNVDEKLLRWQRDCWNANAATRLLK